MRLGIGHWWQGWLFGVTSHSLWKNVLPTQVDLLCIHDSLGFFNIVIHLDKQQELISKRGEKFVNLTN